MEEVVRKGKRLPPQSANTPPRKNRRTGVRAAGTKSSVLPTTIQKQKSSHSTLTALGIELSADTARQAIILSEIIGKPVSKRSRR
ncbi:MAG: hypothetical protein LBC73_05895 [Oscillospiraceae bacterium]|jgi:hypothetical protein|nr:hypothetical protein [Oscillospiraceae bacterium]